MALDLIELDDRFTQGMHRNAEMRSLVVTTDGGYRVGVQKWANTRRSYEVDFKSRSMADITAFGAFFQARGGRARAFLIRDDADYKIVNVNIGTGNGVKTVFQLANFYPDAVSNQTRLLYYPIPAGWVSSIGGLGTPPGVRVSVDGVAKTESTDYNVSYNGKFAGGGGAITFVTAPANTKAVVVTSAWFFTPVIFDLDSMESVLNGVTGDVQGIRLVEVLGE